LVGRLAEARDGNGDEVIAERHGIADAGLPAALGDGIAEAPAVALVDARAAELGGERPAEPQPRDGAARFRQRERLQRGRDSLARERALGLQRGVELEAAADERQPDPESDDARRDDRRAGPLAVVVVLFFLLLRLVLVFIVGR